MERGVQQNSESLADGAGGPTRRKPPPLRTAGTSAGRPWSARRWVTWPARCLWSNTPTRDPLLPHAPLLIIPLPCARLCSPPSSPSTLPPNSGHQLLLPPADRCPISAVWTTREGARQWGHAGLRRLLRRRVSRGLQLQYLWIIPAAAVSLREPWLTAATPVENLCYAAVS